MGSFLGCPESPRVVPVNVIVATPPPSTTILVATADITLRVIDCRTFQYVNEMKVRLKKQASSLDNNAAPLRKQSLEV